MIIYASKSLWLFLKGICKYMSILCVKGTGRVYTEQGVQLGLTCHLVIVSFKLPKPKKVRKFSLQVISISIWQLILFTHMKFRCARINRKIIYPVCFVLAYSRTVLALFVFALSWRVILVLTIKSNFTSCWELHTLFLPFAVSF